MAKVSFTKLGLKVDSAIKILEYNEQNIEIKQYLPIQSKLELIANVINLSHDENNFSNPIKVDIYTAIGIMEYYTNINFTEKQKEDVGKLFDLISSTGLYNAVLSNIPEEEIKLLKDGIYRSIKSIYKYRNSVLGILDTVKTDYSNLDLDASNIQEKLADPENMELLKGIMSKLG